MYEQTHEIHTRKASQISFALVFAGLLAACGGGGGSGGDTFAGASGAGSVVELPSVVTPDLSQPVLTLPTSIANNSVVELACGRSYVGTLNLSGKSGVTVRTAGSCGKAVISPGQNVTGWRQESGQIWSAPLSFDAAQVMVNGQPQERAHWPNRPQVWAKSTSASASSLGYAMPNADLVGATVVFRPYDWAIEGRRISAYSNGVMSLASLNDAAFGGFTASGPTDFYVEGKLWMLDTPGEWAVSNGRLYLMTADGQTPEGRTWASPDAHGVDASNSTNVVLQNISVYGAGNGIYADGARGLQVQSVDISNASRFGIWNSGGSGLLVDGANIRNVRNDAIAVRWGGGNEVIRNSQIEASGVVGMPTNSRAAVNLTLSTGATISGNSVKNSGYIGIRFFRNHVVTGNTVDGACLVLTDCGGMYGLAGDGSPLSTRVQGNTIKNAGTGQHLGWGIYLDTADGMSILDNVFVNNGTGINIQDSSNLVMTGNQFQSSSTAHVQMVETGSGNIRNVSVKSNSFTARAGEESYRLSSDKGSASVGQFATYDLNTYRSTSPVFVNFNGAALSWSQWRSQTGQDAGSSFAP